jgi:hypothetical protein
LRAPNVALALPFLRQAGAWAPCEQAAVESMPIIIDEIVISVEVTDRISAGVGSPSTEPDTQFIVERCVERVLAILREREERTP